MKIDLAKTGGFCFGVERAVQMVYKEAEQSDNVYTYGPIIHNDEVVHDLSKKGVQMVHNLNELKKISKGTIIIRSHGVSKDVYEMIEEQGLKLVDATCPYVRKIHKIVKEQSELLRHIIIIGNNSHPEVEGIKSWCSGPVTVIETIAEAEKFEALPCEKVCIVSQTTFKYNKFQDLVEIIEKKGYDILVLNTICNATEVRQGEAREMAKTHDAMIVIGGKHSSNTQKLYEICKKECEDTYYIQTLSDLDLEKFKSFRSVGITAGASTPNNIIKEVQIACQK